MRAELKRASADEVDIRTYVPEDPEYFFLTLRLRIGEEGHDRGDDFELSICTPLWLRENIYTPLWGRHYLIVRDFNYKLIIDTVISNISQCTGENWTDVARMLARLFSWEFEDYREI